jgi:hypothetical protein
MATTAKQIYTANVVNPSTDEFSLCFDMAPTVIGDLTAGVSGGLQNPIDPPGPSNNIFLIITAGFNNIGPVSANWTVFTGNAGPIPPPFDTGHAATAGQRETFKLRRDSTGLYVTVGANPEQLISSAPFLAQIPTTSIPASLAAIGGAQSTVTTEFCCDVIPGGLNN